MAPKDQTPGLVSGIVVLAVILFCMADLRKRRGSTSSKTKSATVQRLSRCGLEAADAHLFPTRPKR